MEAQLSLLFTFFHRREFVRNQAHSQISPFLSIRFELKTISRRMVAAFVFPSRRYGQGAKWLC
jgi:hypothetical protein